MIVLFENGENECATVSIPILDVPTRKLDRNSMQIDEGYIYVFPVIDED